MIFLKRNAGYSIVEMLVAIIVLVIISLGYIKHKADLAIYEREQYLYNEVKENIISYHRLLLNRVKNGESINISELNSAFINFTKSNCVPFLNNSLTNDFKLSFCHIIDQNRNARFNIYECENSICFTYRPNRFAIENDNKCSDEELCIKEILWGLTDSNDKLVIKGDI